MTELNPTVRHLVAQERRRIEAVLHDARKAYEDAPRRIEFLEERLKELKEALGEK